MKTIAKTGWLLNLAVILAMLLAGLPVLVSSARAASSELFFSEYIEGSSNNKALEIYNGTGAAVDLAAGGYNVQMFFNGNPVSTLTINLTGTVADGDVFVLAQSSANATILAQADQTNGSGWFNGDDAVVLRKSGASGAIIDVIGQIGFDPGTEWGTGITSTADNTIRRMADICAGDPDGSDAFNPSTEWDGFTVDTFDGLGLHAANCAVEPPAPKINEFSASTAGTDVEYVEFLGDPNTDYSAYTLLEIEGDFSGTATGVVDEVLNLGTTDANGYFLANLPANALENGTITLLLVKNFSGALNNDLDSDDNGTLDATPWDAVVDSVAVFDGGASDLTYGVPALGPNYDGVSSFAPGGASRIPDGFDTDTVSDWVRNDFDLAGIPGFDGTPVSGEAYNTPGAINEVIVPPQPQLVINEIDYDQPGTDTAEFVEIKNAGLGSANLSEYTLELVNGTGGGAAVYDTISLPAVSLAPGDYFVVCANAATVANCDLDDDPNTDFIQNGAPDAVGLRRNGTLIDAVSYEGNSGAPYTEGSGVGLEDVALAGLGISRCPDGNETNQNNVDFTSTGITPGTMNSCPLPGLSVSDVSANEGNAGTTTFDFTVSLAAPAGVGGVTFDIATADGTATATDNDYVANSLTGQSIPAGSASYTFSVLVNGDAIEEPDETFFVNVTNVAGATVSDGQGQGTIVNEDTNFCALAYTPIYTIQGSGLITPIPGTVTTQGVVVGDFEGTAAASGFYMQDLSGDGDAATSDGIFVYTGSNNFVDEGQVVRVTGYARERFNQTTLNGSNSNTAVVPAANIVQCGTGSVTPSEVTLPVTALDDFERYEGMLVRFPQALVIAEYFNYDRFGEIVLALPLDGETRPFTGTAIDEPGAPANARTLANSLSRITLDDVQSAQNPPALRHPNGLPFSLSNLFRGGDTVTNAIGVLGYDFNLYRIVPTGPADYTAANPRPASPEPVGGTVRVAAMNTLNFFVTADYPTGNPLDNACGPQNNVECRGWDSDQATEFTRQRDKLLQALSGLDADIIGLNELENSTGVEPLASIVSGMPGYAYIDTGTIGSDAIKVGMIYRPSVVTPVGAFQTLESNDDPRFLDTKNRPSLAQTFEVNATGARFTVVVNHLKSKGSDCNDVGDPDLGDGQGNCSQTRRAAAEALVDWLASDPTGSGDPDFIIMGDLNSYAQEDTIDEIKAGSDDVAGTSDDFTNLMAHFQGTYAYSYTFDGQAGYLDYALANASLFAQISGAADWHINSDEPDVLDYDTTFKPPAQDALYEANAYRTSDHDPVVVGLIPNASPTVNAGGPYSVNEGSSVMVTATGNDPNGDLLSYAWDLDNNGSFETPGQSATFLAANLDGPSSSTIQVKVIDPGGLSAVSQATVNVLNANPIITTTPASQAVQYSDPVAAVTITGADVSADIPLSIATVDLPAWLTLSSPTCGSSSCTWTLSGTALAAPGTYVVGVQVTDKDGGFSETDVTIEVIQEDARVTYTGALFASTASPTSSVAEVTLAATVQDISVTSDAGLDDDPGDIRNATVTFVNRDTNEVLCEAEVGLVDPVDLRTGTATCTWTVDLGTANGMQVRIGIVVGGYYLRDDPTNDDVLVTISKALDSQFITGGGYLVLEDSAGELAGDDGSKANFGFNVKYNKSGKNLTGKVTILIRRLEVDGIVHVYQIKSNSITSLSVNVNEGTAVFNGKANIKDVTDPLNPIAIAGNATLQIVMDDNGEPGAQDTLGITLWKGNGGLWFASQWDGTQTVQQYLDGGNLVVH